LLSAAAAGDIQYMGLPGGEALAVLDDATPVNLTLGGGGPGSKLVVTRYVDGVAQTADAYTNLSGTLTLSNGSGGVTAVAADGAPLAPDEQAPGGGETGGGGQTGGGQTGGGDVSPGTTSPDADATTAPPVVAGTAVAPTTATPAPSTRPAQPTKAKAKTKTTKKPVRCRRGYVKRKVKGKTRCVRRASAKHHKTTAQRR
jgi:hypothetical protein